MLPPLRRIGSSCCTRKNGARMLTANSLSKIFDRRVLDARRFRHAGVGDENVEPVADDLARPLRESVRPVGRRKVHPAGVGAPSALANLGHDPLRLLGPLLKGTRTWAPASASLSALARPRPRDAPVTSAVFPVSEATACLLICIVLRRRRRPCRRASAAGRGNIEVIDNSGAASVPGARVNP